MKGKEGERKGAGGREREEREEKKKKENETKKTYLYNSYFMPWTNSVKH